MSENRGQAARSIITPLYPMRPASDQNSLTTEFVASADAAHLPKNFVGQAALFNLLWNPCTKSAEISHRVSSPLKSSESR
jgi:hypothetical protein